MGTDDLLEINREFRYEKVRITVTRVQDGAEVSWDALMHSIGIERKGKASVHTFPDPPRRLLPGECMYKRFSNGQVSSCPGSGNTRARWVTGDMLRIEGLFPHLDDKKQAAWLGLAEYAPYEERSSDKLIESLSFAKRIQRWWRDGMSMLPRWWANGLFLWRQWWSNRPSLQ